MDITIEPVTQSDETRVNDFLHKQFYTNEPLNAAMHERFRAKHGREGDASIRNPNCVHTNLSNGLCLKAVDGEGNLVGVVVNTCPINGLEVSIGEIQGQQDLMEEILKFLHYIDELSGVAKLLAKYDSNVMDIKILSVHCGHQKKGIGARLIEKSIKLAEAKNIKAISIGCSSAYTSAIIQHKFPQFRRVLTHPISQYTDSDGDVVFKVPDPHKEYHVYFYER